jgi:hypothetical protein
MSFKKVSQLITLSVVATAFALPAIAEAGPTAREVFQNRPQKHYKLLNPATQHTAFTSRTGLHKKQFVAAHRLPSKKRGPH